VRIVTLPGVFRPHSDTWLLARCLRGQALPRAASVLDVCTGSGALAVAAARHGAGDVTAIDVSRRAVVTARINARLNRVRIRALRGDLFAPVTGERFDVIVSNPPYVPAAGDRLPTRGRRAPGTPAARVACCWIASATRDPRTCAPAGCCSSCSPRSAVPTRPWHVSMSADWRSTS
jgi:methylase of polypeptide subunit release factors